MKPFEIISREIAFDCLYCPIEKQVVILPNGEQVDWFVNTNRDAVIVLPVLKNGQILLQKNYKHGCGEIVIEFCAGMIDEGEKPEQAAIRELMEETGYSGKLHKVGECFTNPTGSIMKFHYFVCTDCVKKGEQNLESGEQIDLLPVKNLKEAKKIIFNANPPSAVVAIAGLAYLEEFLNR